MGWLGWSGVDYNHLLSTPPPAPFTEENVLEKAHPSELLLYPMPLLPPCRIWQVPQKEVLQRLGSGEGERD